MTQQEKNQYYRKSMVIVQKGAFAETSKCEIKRCKRKPKHLIFVGDDTRLSTLFANSCSHHLATVCNRASVEALQQAEKWIKSAESREREKL